MEEIVLLLEVKEAYEKEFQMSNEFVELIRFIKYKPNMENNPTDSKYTIRTGTMCKMTSKFMI